MAEDRIVTSFELLGELEQSQSEVFSFKLGLPTLDRLLRGVEAGELIVVSGPSGHGKTSLLMSFTHNLVAQGVESVWFTLEVTPRQLMKKLSSGGSTLPYFYIPRRGIDEADPAFIQAWEQAHKRRFEMIHWVEVKIEEAIARAKADGKILRAVFIDHIHQIFSVERVERNVSLELGDMVAKLKQIALRNDLAVFLVAHTKDDPQGTNREPRMTDIRDSGLIVRLADSVIFVWRIPNSDDGTGTRLREINEEDNRAKIRVFKNRREGKLGFTTAFHQDHKLTEQAIDFGGF